MNHVLNPAPITTFRLPTLEVTAGDLSIGNFHPVRIQTMTTTDTMNTTGTVAQVVRCVQAGAELVRITAPNQRDAENLLAIRNALRKQGCTVPLVADIHFTPNAAEIAARIVEKVRINPGNYADKKKFETIVYTDGGYQAELDRIRQRFTPLVKICKEYGTALRIGTNHGSLSDRIMSRYGDTPTGMVESAMEFLRMAEGLHFNNIVLSMKSSRPLIMIEAYRLLVQAMQLELGHCYPLHLGVTEAGDGDAGRIKSAIGIGTLLEEGIGDTIRVSLTEDPEFELPVCKSLVNHYAITNTFEKNKSERSLAVYTPGPYRRTSEAIDNIGGNNVPVVVADYSQLATIAPGQLQDIGYVYNEVTDKWNIGHAAADYIFTNGALSFPIPGTLKVITPFIAWKQLADKEKYCPLFTPDEYNASDERSEVMNAILIHANDAGAFCRQQDWQQHEHPKVVLVLYADALAATRQVREALVQLEREAVRAPCILQHAIAGATGDDMIVQYALHTGNLLLNGIGDGVWLMPPKSLQQKNEPATLNGIAFGILQATHTRISGTEYISCPSCGRTLFDLQETTARIRAATHHLKGVKIAIMGCIVNGPGEMADADFGYVGSGPGKISLYKGKDMVKRNISSEVAVTELIDLIKENGRWEGP